MISLIYLIPLFLIVPIVRRFLFSYLPLVPSFTKWKIIDIYRYIKYKQWLLFDGFGLHIFVGLFGKGKTISMVQLAYSYACRYPHLNIYTNIDLKDFPNPERITRLVNYNQIIDSPPDSLFVIDEISTLFQSRSWANFPMPLLSQLLQVRKNKKMIIATAQRFSHVDKLIRDVTYSVIDCNCIFKRWNFCTWYIAEDWEDKNPMSIPVPYNRSTFIQTDKLRNLYDTYEIISNKNKEDFLTSEEILTRQAGSSTVVVGMNQPKKTSILNKLK
ncbi:zonular occludens toxin domain-containing protein [Acetoanaerobium sticklandii]|uniref:zonular occludens toxin domain-containing protein n=1 Tax=Acetoanaerobium sticklandii TaxID=1511 RepID=UPI003A92720B